MYTQHRSSSITSSTSSSASAEPLPRPLNPCSISALLTPDTDDAGSSPSRSISSKRGMDRLENAMLLVDLQKAKPRQCSPDRDHKRRRISTEFDVRIVAEVCNAREMVRSPQPLPKMARLQPASPPRANCVRQQEAFKDYTQSLSELRRLLNDDRAGPKSQPT